MSGMKVFCVLQVWAFNTSYRIQMVECTEKEVDQYRSYLINKDQNAEPTDVICIELQSLQQAIRFKPVRMYDIFKGSPPWAKELPKEEPATSENVFTEVSDVTVSISYTEEDLTPLPLFDGLSDRGVLTEEASTEPTFTEESSAAVGGEVKGFEKMAKMIKEKISGKKV